MTSITYTGSNIQDVRRFTRLDFEHDPRDGTLWVNEVDNPGTDSTLCLAVGDTLTERYDEDGWRHFDQQGKGHRRLAALQVQWGQSRLNGSDQHFPEWLDERLDVHLAEPRQQRLDRALDNLNAAEVEFESWAATNAPGLTGLTTGLGR